MSAVESASVPSQSNTRSRNRRGAASAIGTGVNVAVETCQVRAEIGGQRRGDHDLPAVRRMREADAVRMQKHPFEALLREGAIPGEVAVLVVAGERESEMREMDADLVRTARQELGVEKRERRQMSGPGLHAAEHRVRGTAARRHPRAALALARDPRLERELDIAHGVAPFATDEHEIALLDGSLAQLRVERGERRALSRDQDHAGSVAVETVDELKDASGRARRSRSMRPKAMPLPPWTARPEGLLSAVR